MNRQQKRKFLKEQRSLEKLARRNLSDTRFAIFWKRKPGIYEEGATGHR